MKKIYFLFLFCIALLSYKAQGQVTITSPNGGESLEAGSVHPITWNSSFGNSFYQLYYSMNGGTNYTLIYMGTLNGSYNWTIPNEMGSNVLVKVQHNSGSLITPDVSDNPFSISMNITLSLNIPNGGESWNGGSNQAISWTSNAPASTSLELFYSTDDGTSWNLITSGTAGTFNGSYSWEVVNIGTTQGRVKIQTSDESQVISSASSFTIVQQPDAITLTAPDGGQYWQAGTVQTITWNDNLNPSKTIDIEYSSDNGSTWNSIVSGTAGSFNGSYAWTIPMVVSTQARVRVQTSDLSAIDASNSVFNIRHNVFLTFPNGGENLYENSIQTISWNSTATTQQIRLYFSQNGGSTWNPITTAIASTLNGSYDWTVPAGVISNYRVKVEIFDPIMYLILATDQSEANFSVVQAPGTVLTPNSGEYWKAGTQQEITWSTIGIGTGDNMRISHSTDGGSTWIQIVEDLESVLDGSYTWTVPNISGSMNQIKVEDLTLGTSDISDFDFAIEPIVLTVTSPNGGQYWEAGSQYSISWSSMDIQDTDDIEIYYSTDNGSNWNLIASDKQQNFNYSYQWTVPNAPTSSAKIKVVDATWNAEDISDNTFTIAGISVSLATPNGGESWQSGSAQNITWTETNVSSSDNIALYHSSDNGSNWSLIASNSAQSFNRSYEWPVPNEPGSNHLIKVVNTSWSAEDQSNAVFTITPPPAGAMSGTYTIGGTTPDFATFTAAVQAMVTNTIVGPVTFIVRNGTYNEQVTIPYIFGSSPVNAITFQSESGNYSDVTLSATGTFANNFVVKFNGGDYITFSDISFKPLHTTYARAMEFTNKSKNNLIKDSYFLGPEVSGNNSQALVYSSAAFQDEANTFENNRFVKGHSGIYWEGPNSPYDYSMIIKNNVFEDQSRYGIYASNLVGYELEGNEVSTPKISSAYSGIYMYQSSGGRITKNYVHSFKDGNGIYIHYDYSQSGSPLLLANNMIASGSAVSANGYALYFNNGGHIQLYHNSIQSNYSGTLAATLVSAVTNLTSRNNIFAHSGAGFAIYTHSTTMTSDYNNFYTNGVSLLRDFTTNYTLPEWQAAFSRDLNSHNVDPQFAAASDLHIFPANLILNGAGESLAAVADDFDGEPRNNPSDIGADEFDAVANDAGITLLHNPVFQFASGIQNVEITLHNFGIDPLTSATVKWAVNGTGQTPFNWTGNITSTASASSVVIGTYNFLPGIAYEIKVWADDPNGVTDEEPLNDTLMVNDLYAALNGIYTLGGTNPNFTDFANAIESLEKGGMLGSVQIKVRTGTYTEQILVSEFPGLSATNTLSFISETQNKDDVILSIAPTLSANYLVKFDNADNVDFSHMSFRTTGSTYGRIAVLENGIQNSGFDNCKFTGLVSSTFGDAKELIRSVDPANASIFVTNSILENGNVGIALEGENGNLQNDNLIQNNVFVNPGERAIGLKYQQSTIVSGNTITSSNSGFGDGIYMERDQRNVKVERNRIYGLVNGYGIRAYYTFGTASENTTIANNMIQIQNNTDAGISVDYYSEYINVYYNSIAFTAPIFDDEVAFILGSNVSNINVYNNIFANLESGSLAGRAMSIASNASYNSDYNNLFGYNGITSSTTTLAEWQAASGKDLNSYSYLPAFVSVNDLHLEANWQELNGKGMPLSVTIDFDGETRNETIPDIGADEYDLLDYNIGAVLVSSPVKLMNDGVHSVEVSISNFGSITTTSATIHWSVNGSVQTPFSWTGSVATEDTASNVSIGSFDFSPVDRYTIKVWTSMPNGIEDEFKGNDTVSVIYYPSLCGTYTIGGTTPDFATMAEAVNALNDAGVTCAVTFNIRSGTYTERYDVRDISGSSALNTVTFQSESGNNSDVVLMPDSDGYLGAVFGLDGADYLTLKDLTLDNTGTYSTSFLIKLTGGSHYNTFENLIFINEEGEGQTGIYSGVNTFSGYRSVDEYNTVNNCTFTGGADGVAFNDIHNGYYEYGNKVLNSTFSDINRAINLGYQYGPVAESNTIIRCGGGIYVYYSYDAVVRKNKITEGDAGYGIWLSYSEDSRVENNFIHLQGAADMVRGLYLIGADGSELYFNSVNITNTNASSVALWADHSDLDLKNTVLNIDGGAVFHRVSSQFFTFVSDYNAYYTSGPVFATQPISTTYATFADWKTATSQDANSIVVQTVFVSDTDLHTFDSNLESKGTSIAGIVEDIDGETRNISTPDIGADEFVSSPTTGITSAQKMNVLIYPVPAVDKVIVKVEDLQEVRLLSPEGKEIKAVKGNGSLVTIPLEGISSGTYCLHIRTKNNVEVRKITVIQ